MAATTLVLLVVWLPFASPRLLAHPLLEPGMAQLRTSMCTLLRLSGDSTSGPCSVLCHALTPAALGTLGLLFVGGVLPLYFIHFLYERHVVDTVRAMEAGRPGRVDVGEAFAAVVLLHVPVLLAVTGGLVALVLAAGILAAG